MSGPDGVACCLAHGSPPGIILEDKERSAEHQVASSFIKTAYADMHIRFAKVGKLSVQLIEDALPSNKQQEFIQACTLGLPELKTNLLWLLECLLMQQQWPQPDQ